MGKGVTRPNLKYVWIELETPTDGQAFSAGMNKLGWRNAMLSFPREKDKLGTRYVDSEHPLIPIRWRGNALIVSPNYFRVADVAIKDPIFEDYLKTHSFQELESEMGEEINSLCRWVFNPGIRKVSKKESRLTNVDATDYADLVAVSGHGIALGGAGIVLAMPGTSFPISSPLIDEGDVYADSNRLKYIIIPACMNVTKESGPVWMKVMRRNNPVHGFLGYTSGYPGEGIGRRVFEEFTIKLREKGRNKTILEAWREANIINEKTKEAWSALIHTSATNDTMKDWMSNKLRTPDKNGEIRWFSEENYPKGDIVVETTPEYSVFFTMNKVRIDRHNNGDKDVGLISGEAGSLEFVKESGVFKIGDVITAIFYLYRPNHNPGVNLSNLLVFDTPNDGKLQLLTDVNKQDKDKYVDAIKFEVTKDKLPKISLSYKVKPDAYKHFKEDRVRAHGYFWIKLEVVESEPLDVLRFAKEYRFPNDGACLWEPK